MTIYDNWVGFSGVYRVCSTTVDVWSSNWESSWEWGTKMPGFILAKGNLSFRLAVLTYMLFYMLFFLICCFICCFIFYIFICYFFYMLFFDPYIVWQRETSFRLIQKKSRNSSPIGTHWDDHPLLSLSSNSWDGLSRKSRGFSASFWRPNQGPLRSELRSSLKDILESIFVNKNTFEIHIYYHLFSFIFIYSHLLSFIIC